MNTNEVLNKLITEIERQQRGLILLSNTEQVDMRRDCAIQNGVYDNILGIISSLQKEQPIKVYRVENEKEQPEADLEKEIRDTCRGYRINDYHEQELSKQDIENIARHFYELGLEARKEE